MPPPQLSIRIGRLASGHHDARAPRFVDGHHFDAIQVVRRETELPAQEAEGAAHHVTAHADSRIFAERKHGSPCLEQRLKRLADRRAGLDRDGAACRVVVDPFHRRDIDDHADVGIGDESLEAMPAARDHHPLPLVHGFLHRRQDLLC